MINTKTNTMTVHFANGIKGGVGKSQLAQCLINYLSATQPVNVIEADTSTPDVARGVSKSARDIVIMSADMRTDDGWQQLFLLLEQFAQDPEDSQKAVVISLPGADLDYKRYAEVLGDVKEAWGFTVYEWFLLSAQEDSVDHLMTSLNTGIGSIADRNIAVKNGLFGEASKFVIFNQSKTSQRVEAMYLPPLSLAFAKELRQSTKTVDETAAEAMAGNSRVYAANLGRWTNKVNAEFDRLLSSPVAPEAVVAGRK